MSDNADDYASSYSENDNSVIKKNPDMDGEFFIMPYKPAKCLSNYEFHLMVNLKDVTMINMVSSQDVIRFWLQG